MKNQILYFIIGLTKVNQKFKADIITTLNMLKHFLASETDQTKEMINTYIKWTQKEVSPEDLEKANKQFRQVLKSVGLGAFAILPLAPITIPLIVKLGNRFNIDILPHGLTDYKDRKKEDEKKNKQRRNK